MVVSQVKPYYEPLSREKRAPILPERGFCSIRPARCPEDALLIGNGTVQGLVFGDPLHEIIALKHERMLIPQWKTPPEAPRIAKVLPQVRRLLLDEEFGEAAALAIQEARKDGYPASIEGDGYGIPNNVDHYGVIIRLSSDAAGGIDDYVRTLDFRSGEALVHWSDSNGRWTRRVFASRADNVIVIAVDPPSGQIVDMGIELGPALRPDEQSVTRGITPAPEGLEFEKAYSADHITATGRYDPAVGGPQGYAVAARVIAPGGDLLPGTDSLRVEGARSITVVARLDRYQKLPDDGADRLLREIEGIEGDFDLLLERHKAIHAPMFNRVRLELQKEEPDTLSSEEMQIAQLKHEGLHPTFLEKLFDMGRYRLLATTGAFPSIWGHININVNLQVAAGGQGGLPELMESYFRWIEGCVADFRQNAENIFGCRGIVAATHPDQEHGRLFHLTRRWPHHYWISGAGWCLQPFWEHYQITGDHDFARSRLLPLYKEVAAFYEDYMAETDDSSRYVFAPSYSPENWPGNLDQPRSVVVNSTMDIMVCREVLSHLVELCETLGIEQESEPRWRDLMEKLPPYLYDDLGALKEWAWPSLEENADHRHLSHLYGAWPGDEITPDGTPDLAEAAILANRKRGQGNGSAHGVMHRALVAARLKDPVLVSRNLKQILDNGYVNPSSLTTNHNPFRWHCPDASGSIPALVIEMLLYSYPGIVELLPAAPTCLRKGTLHGVRLRTGAIANKLSWDLESSRIDLAVTSLRDQQIDVVYRRGISKVEASEEKTVVRFHEGEDRLKIDLPAKKHVDIAIHTAGQ